MHLTRNQVFENYLLVDAVPLSDDKTAFVALSHPAHRDGVFISQHLEYCDSAWTKGPYFGWEAVSISKSPNGLDSVLILGRDGFLVEVTSQGARELPAPDCAEPAGPYRQVSLIEGRIILLGEDSGVWLLGPDRWNRLDSGLPPLSTESAPLEDDEIDRLIEETEILMRIAGRTTSDLCAAGTSGGLWQWNGDEWQWQDTGTNLNFYDVTLHGDQFAVCGQAGAVYVGNRGLWKAENTSEIENDFVSIASYNKKIFVADGEGLYESKEAGLVRIPLVASSPVPIRKVIASENLVVAIAAKEFFFSNDGEKWTSGLLG